MKIDRIISLAVVGGFLDGARVEFAPGLNCIIGARGTGKTTILELIRYALDALPRRDLSPAGRRRIESLVEGNLQGGRVELEIETRDGLRYFVVRSVGEDPIVLDASRNPTPLSVDGRSPVFRADIFSQNEVETIADHSRFQLELIDSFAREKIAEMDREVNAIALEVTSLAKRVGPMALRWAALEEEVKQLPMVEERLKSFRSRKGSSAEAVDEAHAFKALRDRETRTVSTALQSLASLEEDISELSGRLSDGVIAKFTREMLNGPNGRRMIAIRNQVKACAKSVDAALREANEAVRACIADVERDTATLKLDHNQQELAFREVIEKDKRHQTQSAERSQLERKRNKITEARAQALELQRQIRETEQRRVALLRKLTEARDQRFRVRKEVAKRLNTALSPNIAVSIRQAGCTQAYVDLLETSLKNTGVRPAVVAQKLARTLPPEHLASLIREKDAAELIERGGINSDQVSKVIGAFDTPEKLAKLETVELSDAPSIRLRVGDQAKDSETLSTGQKCTTILPILLLEGANPLLIDQPEDNLDNRFIFETVVDNIQKVKKTRQLIFVTHNPNIPVLGDASQVLVMDSDGEHGGTSATGSVDQCKTSIVTLLEGGADAFRRRSQRYGTAVRGPKNGARTS